MEDFCIFALGNDFDVDAFVRTTSLNIAKVWRRGDMPHPHSGVVIELSTSRTLPLHEQDRIAAKYLEDNEEQLKHLAKFPGVEAFTLAFQEHVILERSLSGIVESVSLRLMYFALSIGIIPSVYVNFDWSKVDDERDQFMSERP